MKKESHERHIIDMIFVIALLFLFAMSALMLIAIGSSIYIRGVNSMQKNYDRRTAYAYITEKIRQNDAQGNISSDTFNKSGAIRIDSTEGGKDYVTYIYDYDGALMELKARADVENLLPETGQRIMDIDSLEINTLGGGILEVTIALQDGEEITFVTSKRSEKGQNDA